jgi:hypothetical protein
VEFFNRYDAATRASMAEGTRARGPARAPATPAPSVADNPPPPPARPVILASFFNKMRQLI